MNSVALNYMVSLAFLSKIRRRLAIKCLHPAPVVQRVDSTQYPRDNSTGFGSIYPLDNSLHPLNNWGLIYVHVISCRTLKQEDCLRAFSTYLLLKSLFPSRAVVFLHEDLSQNAYKSLLPVRPRAIHQACNFLPSLGELFAYLLCEHIPPLQGKQNEGSVKVLSAS